MTPASHTAGDGYDDMLIGSHGSDVNGDGGAHIFAAGITTQRLNTTGDGRIDYQMKINGDVTDHVTAWLL